MEILNDTPRIESFEVGFSENTLMPIHMGDRPIGSATAWLQAV
jgi:hypothetical protein